jgi:uncharacterized membrane protein
MKKLWTRKALSLKRKGVKLTFTVTESIKNKHQHNLTLDIKGIITIYLPTAAYNQILRKLKIDSLLNNSGKVTVDQIYHEALEFNRRFEVNLQEFKIV